MLFFLSAAISCGVVLLVTPPVGRLGRAMGAVDLPDGGRHLHSRPTPRLGGLGLLLGYASAAALLWPMGQRLPTVLLPGGLLVAALGVCDDCRSLSPRLKLLGQSAAGCVMAALLLPSVGRVALLAVLLLPLLANAFNMTDGSDGLAPALGGVAGGVLALFGAAYMEGYDGAVAVGLALSAACLGFLPYNRSPASVFQGDTGSMLTGTLLAGGLLFLSPRLIPIGLTAAAGWPLFELGTSVLRRWRAGRPLFSADRGHLHHRLADRGYSPRQIALLAASLSLLWASFWFRVKMRGFILAF